MKKRIRLTESDLHRIINESVKRIINETINEYPYSPYPKDSEKDRQWCENTYLPTTVAYWKAKHPEWSEEQCREAVKNMQRNNETQLRGIIKESVKRIIESNVNDWDVIRDRRADGFMETINYYLDIMDERGYLSDEQKNDATQVLNKLTCFGGEAEKFCDVARKQLGLINTNDKINEAVRRVLKKYLR